MNVKLQIKEVKEERRGLSDTEWYAYFAGQRIVELLVYLDKVGLDIKSVDTYERVGTFHTETIRDATPTEVIAWHTLQSFDKCIWTHIACDACAKKIGPTDCHITEEWDRAEEILKGKEVIVEVVK
jgi:hypothetical protein